MQGKKQKIQFLLIRPIFTGMKSFKLCVNFIFYIETSDKAYVVYGKYGLVLISSTKAIAYFWVSIYTKKKWKK